LTFALLGASGCSTVRSWIWERELDTSRRPPVVEAPREFHRGFLSFGETTQSFTPCGQDRAYWVVDETGGALRQVHADLSAGRREPVYAEVRGRVGPATPEHAAMGYAGELTVGFLAHAAPAAETRGCGGVAAGVQYRASGNEPFWSVEIGPRRIELRRPDEPTRLLFPLVLPTTRPGLVIYETSTLQAPVTKIRITLEPNPCIDTMSGAYHTWSATVEVGNRTYKGCAIQGWGA
jgi:putative lipoprotein